MSSAKAASTWYFLVTIEPERSIRNVTSVRFSFILQFLFCLLPDCLLKLLTIYQSKENMLILIITILFCNHLLRPVTSLIRVDTRIDSINVIVNCIILITIGLSYRFNPSVELIWNLSELSLQVLTFV